MHIRLPLLALGVVLLVAGPAVAQSDHPPNVIVILADDLGYGDLSAYGDPGWETPRLDRMAAEGARLTQFYVPVPYCGPSRATLLTGRYPFNHGFTSNPAPDGPARVDTIGISSDEVLLSEVFRRHGYATGMVGKWHLGHQPRFLPTRHGFDEYLGILYSNDMRPVELVESRVSGGDAEVVEYPIIQATLTRRYTDRALDFVRRNRDRPFFLYLAHAMPHKPLAASEAYYTPDTPDDLYADVVRELDAEVGRLLDGLDELGLDEETLVVFMSDNGPWFGGSTAGLRGMKSQTWEGGLRVPFIARWPGHIPAGHVSDAVTSSVDVFPTALDVTGVPPPEGVAIDGHSLMPVLTSDAPSPHEAVFGMHGDGVYVVRSGPWKLHLQPPVRHGYMAGGWDWKDPRGPDGVTIIGQYEQPMPPQHPGVDAGAEPRPMMLFNLDSDPAEQRDVAAEHADVVEWLRALAGAAADAK